jgi:hypothetical protein
MMELCRKFSGFCYVIIIVSGVVGAVELVFVVVVTGSLLYVVRCLCFCVFTRLVFVMPMSSDLAVMRRARNMLCGVACGCKTVVGLLDCLRRFLVAFFGRVCGSFRVTCWKWGCVMLVGLEVCVLLWECVLRLRRSFLSSISTTLHIGSIGIPFVVSGVIKRGIISLDVFH